MTNTATTIIGVIIFLIVFSLPAIAIKAAAFIILWSKAQSAIRAMILKSQADKLL